MVILKKVKNFISKILIISGKNFRIKILKIIGLSFGLSIMEFIGISVLVSFILYVFGAEELKITRFLNLDYFGKFNLIYFVFVIYTLKFVLSIFSQIKINTYLFDLHLELSKKLLKFYLQKPYSFFVKTNSSILIRNVYSEIGIFTYQIIVALSILINDLILISLMIFLLLMNDFSSTFIILTIFFLFYIFYYYTSKPFVKKWGEILVKQKYLVHNDLKETFNSIKEIKVFGSENYFINKFDNDLYKYSRSSRNQSIIAHFPKIFFEYLLVIIFVILIFIFQLKGTSNSNILINITLFAAVSIRLIPSLSRLSTHVQGIIFYKPSVDILFDEISKIDPNTIEKHSYLGNIDENDKNFKLEKFISIKNLDFSYSNKGEVKKIVENLNCNFYKNNIIGIFGQSGEGKTTLVDIISGLLKPEKGEILIDGAKNLNDRNIRRKWVKKIGYVTQNIYLLNDTVKQNILYDTKDFDYEKFQFAIKQSKFNEVLENLPNKEETIISENGINLSGGQIKRLALARALYRNPDLLILDETMSSLDQENQDNVLSNLTKLKKNKIIIIISHNKGIIKYCDELFYLQNKKLNIYKSS